VKDGVSRGDTLEVFERRSTRDGEVRPCPGRDLQVTSQDRCALFDGHVLKAHRAPAPLSQHRTAACGTRVGDPVRSLAEHGDKVALALAFGDRYRERDEPSGLAAEDFERCHTIPQASSKDDRPEPILDAGPPLRSAAAVLPGLERPNDLVHRCPLSPSWSRACQARVPVTISSTGA
jgi:hypothetical protein